METKFTPGPWEGVYDDNGFYFVVPKHERGPSPYIVATGGEGDVDERNALLCAAAPDLLRQLSRAASMLKIAAACFSDDTTGILNEIQTQISDCETAIHKATL